MEIRRGTNFSGNNNHKKRKRIRKKGLGKEKVTMLVTSVAVLTVLTVTGVYVGQKNKSDQDNRIIDFSALEDSNENQDVADAESGDGTDEFADGFVEHNDMDVDPDLYREYREANSGDVLNPDLEQNAAEAVTPIPTPDETLENVNEDEVDEPDDAEATEAEDSAESMSSMTIAEIIQEKTDALVFDGSEALAWPVVGNVIMNYSMDSYVYYATLGQYRYSDAIVIGATEGEHITAAADGVVTSVFYDEEIGNGMTVALGSGYELTYGQLSDIQVAEGDTINKGDLLGTVAAPTKYYTLEGTNVYFRMTKDGEPVNPLTLLQ